MVVERCVDFTAKIGGGATEISELYEIIIVWVARSYTSRIIYIIPISRPRLQMRAVLLGHVV